MKKILITLVRLTFTQQHIVRLIYYPVEIFTVYFSGKLSHTIVILAFAEILRRDITKIETVNRMKTKWVGFEKIFCSNTGMRYCTASALSIYVVRKDCVFFSTHMFIYYYLYTNNGNFHRIIRFT